MNAAPSAATPRALYVHVPFCERRCAYCDFVAFAGTRHEVAYVDALCRELDSLGDALVGTRLETIFFGGGTPGLIDPDNLDKIMARITRHFDVAADAEVTLEANPSSTTAERAERWLAAGFNRVSLGIQSLEPEGLTFLGRVHDVSRAQAAVADVRRGGFTNVNCDLIYAVPGIDDAAWRHSLDGTIALAPDHISCYELTVEQGTPLHRLVAEGRVTPVDAAAALAQHAITVETLGLSGYRQYEVSNFARGGAVCRHNLVYWHNETYIAAGVGAHGHLDIASAKALGLLDDASVEAAPEAVRYWHTRSLHEYLAQPIVSAATTEPVTAHARWEEAVMLGLRLDEGVVADVLDPLAVDALATAGLVHAYDGRVAVTARGQEVLNAVTAHLVTTAA